MDKNKTGMTYQEAMEYIESLQAYGSVPGLTNIENLCNKLGNPQNELTFIHIAGTNGKGSVLAYVSTILKEAGYRVGRYLSPTVTDYRERIQISGRMIPKTDLCKELFIMKQACEELTAEGKPHPTIFEVETAMAFHYFKAKKCSIVVLETGLGGALDATNIVTNTAVAVFTSISMDHMSVLGNTLEEIARNKAGIFKKNCTAVTLVQKPEVSRILKAKAKELYIPLLEVDKGAVTCVKYGLEKQRFSYGGYKNLEISLAGCHQIDNAVLAVEAVTLLGGQGFPVSEKALRKGLLETKWTGRFEIAGRKPYFITDGAHNRDGALRLAESIRFYFTNKRIIYIMGILRDKECDEIIKATGALAEQIFTVSTPGPRGLSAYDLACMVKKFHDRVTAADSLQEAVELSYLSVDKDTVVIAFGSLSYLGEVLSIVKNSKLIRRDSHGK